MSVAAILTMVVVCARLFHPMWHYYPSDCSREFSKPLLAVVFLALEFVTARSLGAAISSDLLAERAESMD